MQRPDGEIGPLGRRLRLAFANVPVLSLLAFRWKVLHGSVVVDLALSKASAERRARRFIDEDVRRWNSTTIYRAADFGSQGGSDA